MIRRKIATNFFFFTNNYIFRQSVIDNTVVKNFFSIVVYHEKFSEQFFNALKVYMLDLFFFFLFFFRFTIH